MRTNNSERPLNISVKNKVQFLVCTIDDDKCKVQLLNECFAKNFTIPESPIDKNGFSTLGGENCPVDLLCTVEEVFDLICSIGPTKSSGPDQTSARMLRATASSISPAVTQLFNTSIKTGELPTDWKLALITPIPKSGDKSHPNNYRPISLLSILSKLLEKHIYRLILDHVEEQSPISGKQWGFMKGKATTGALLTAFECWHKLLESCNEVCAVFFEFKKAFDSVSLNLLLKMLLVLGLDPYLL